MAVPRYGTAAGGTATLPSERLAEGCVAPPDIDPAFAERRPQPGTTGVTDWRPVGHVIAPEGGEFHAVTPESGHVPRKRGRAGMVE